MGLLETKNGFSDAVLGKNIPVLYFVSKDDCPLCPLMANPVGDLDSERSAFPLAEGTRIQKVNLDKAKRKYINEMKDEGAHTDELDRLEKMREQALFLKTVAAIDGVPTLLLVKDGQVISEFESDIKINNLKPEHIEKWVDKTLTTHSKNQLVLAASGPRELYDELEDDGFALGV